MTRLRASHESYSCRSGGFIVGRGVGVGGVASSCPAHDDVWPGGEGKGGFLDPWLKVSSQGGGSAVVVVVVVVGLPPVCADVRLGLVINSYVLYIFYPFI